MEIRKLTHKDVTRNILDILLSLADTHHLSILDAKLIVLEQIHRGHDTYVLYDIDLRPVAIGSIIITQRLIHNGGRVAFVEDVAVHSTKQRCGYGTKIVNFLEEKAVEAGVYKVILNCSEANRPFYEKLGYVSSGYCMRKDVFYPSI